MSYYMYYYNDYVLMIYGVVCDILNRLNLGCCLEMDRSSLFTIPFRLPTLTAFLFIAI